MHEAACLDGQRLLLWRGGRYRTWLRNAGGERIDTPWKQEIIHGLLGSTILGFHTVRRGGAQETVIVGNGGLRPEQARTGT